MTRRARPSADEPELCYFTGPCPAEGCRIVPCEHPPRKPCLEPATRRLYGSPIRACEEHWPRWGFPSTEWSMLKP